jgi:type I restriction enzyme M protein
MLPVLQFAIWSNGGQISYYNRKDPNFFEDIRDIPKVDQTLEDVIKQRYTLKDLFMKDKIPNEGKSLKQIILELENDVLANAGIDVFEEVFKLIFTKLYDEIKSKNDKIIIKYHLEQKLSNEEKGDFEKVKYVLDNLIDSNFRIMEFRNTGQSNIELKRKIQNLYNEAKDKWHGVFPTDSKIDLSASRLSICVSSLQDIKVEYGTGK